MTPKPEGGGAGRLRVQQTWNRRKNREYEMKRGGLN